MRLVAFRAGATISDLHRLFDPRISGAPPAYRGSRQAARRRVKPDGSSTRIWFFESLAFHVRVHEGVRHAAEHRSAEATAWPRIEAATGAKAGVRPSSNRRRASTYHHPSTGRRAASAVLG